MLPAAGLYAETTFDSQHGTIESALSLSAHKESGLNSSMPKIQTSFFSPRHSSATDDVIHTPVANGNAYLPVKSPMTASEISIVVTSPTGDGSRVDLDRMLPSFSSADSHASKVFESSDKKTKSEKRLEKKEKEQKSKKLRQFEARNEHFRRLFGECGDVLINYYHCALCQEILIQGTLYVSQNWFCFHSKLLGKRNIVKIPVSEVINITKMKTAGIIPNAIGVETATAKYTFGSLMGRQNTYRLMCDIWHTYQESLEQHDVIGSESYVEDDVGMTNGEKNAMSENDSTSVESTDGETVASPTEVFSPETPLSDTSSLSVLSPTSDVVDDVIRAESVVNAFSLAEDSSIPNPSLVTRPHRASSRTVAVRSPCLLLLYISAALLLVITVVTVLLAFKIIRLQALVEVKLPIDVSSERGTLHIDHYEQHLMNVHQLQEIISLHKRLLEQVNRSIAGLADLAFNLCPSQLASDCKAST